MIELIIKSIGKVKIEKFLRFRESKIRFNIYGLILTLDIADARKIGEALIEVSKGSE